MRRFPSLTNSSYTGERPDLKSQMLGEVEVSEAHQFVQELRVKEPTLPIVVAVTHLDRCAAEPGYSAQKCAEELAESIGCMEEGSVFPLANEVHWQGETRPGELRVRLSATTLAPIVDKLKLKANEFYVRELDLAA